MKKINEAYETLSDVVKRRVYDTQRIKKPDVPHTVSDSKPTPKKDEEVSYPSPAKEVLEQYFDCIKAGDFEGAYDLITVMDKKNITQDDFVKWQSGVTRIYSLQEYAIKADKVDVNFKLGGRIFSLVVEFSVNTVEQNSYGWRMTRSSKRLFMKIRSGGFMSVLNTYSLISRGLKN